MRILANSVHLRAPLWDHVEALGVDGDTAFAELCEVVFEVVEADRVEAEKRAKRGRRGR